jgi:hypothetical protein
MTRWIAPDVASIRGDNSRPLQKIFGSLSEYIAKYTLDVSITSPTANQTLSYDATTSLWKNIVPNASYLGAGTVPSARIAGAYTGITSVGTLTGLTVTGGTGTTIASISNTLINGTDNSSAIYLGGGVGSVATGGIEVSWRGATNPSIAIGVTRDNNGTKTVWEYSNKIYSYIAGTLRSTLSPTGFKIDTGSSPTISIQEWSASAAFAAIETTKGYLLLGATSGNDNVYLRANGAGAVVRLGGNASDTLTVGNGDSTFSGTLNGNGVWNNTNDIKASNLWITSYLIANTGVTGSGQSAQWITAFGFWYLIRNSSTRNDKENVQPLNAIVTPSMIDAIDISLWSRKNGGGIPEIGPMAEDMDAISPFLSTRGMDYDESGNVVQTEPNGINTNSWISLLTLGIQDLRKRVEELEKV